MQSYGFFSDNNIQLPTAVKNAIEDVFNENENIAKVECYTIDELEDFQKDIRLKNEITMYLDGRNEGTTFNSWTYYGEVYHSYSEKTVLLEADGTVVDIISEMEATEDALIARPDEFLVLLLEKMVWKSPNELEREMTLYLYCPISLNEEPDQYADVYNQIKSEEY